MPLRPAGKASQERGGPENTARLTKPGWKVIGTVPTPNRLTKPGWKVIGTVPTPNKESSLYNSRRAYAHC